MKKALVVLLALALFMPVQLSLFTSSAYAAQPVSGITDFGNTYEYPANNVDASEPDGYVVPNIVNSGWDFRMFADNDALDAAVNVEAFTGQTVLAYGASNRGLIEVTSIQLSPNDGTLFDLNSVDITFDSGVNEGAKNVELLGYKGGLPVAGATLTKLVYPASYLPPGEGLVSFNVSGVPAFQGVDGFRVLAPPDSVGVYAIGVDNINAINFRNATEAPTYTISVIDDQTLDAVTEGYVSGTQDTNTVAVNRTGTGTLSNVAANLSGVQASAFELSTLSATTLDAATPSATFTVKAKDGLAVGTYTATVTVSATNMTDEVFTVTQVVTAAPTYTISAIDDQTLDAVTEGYASGTQDTNTITVNRTGTGTLSNVAASLNGVQASAFELSPLSATTLNSTTPSATFTVKAKDGLTVGIYTATVTVTADSLANEVFTVTQVVTAQGQVAAPFASPGGGSVTAGTQVSLTSLTNGAVIHYTLDGSTPTANSPIYSTPITVSAAMTLKAVAVKNDMLTSSIFRASYTIAAPSPQTPTPQTPTPQTPLLQTPAPQTQMPQTPAPQTSTTTGVDVLVNGKIENAGVAAKSERNGQSVTTITVDEQKLQQRLAAEGNEALITIPITATSDVVIGELNGRMVKNMQSTQAVVELRTERAAYTLPARQINMDSISAQIGQNVELQDIKIKIEIATPKVDTMQLVEQSGKKGSFDLVAPAIEFTVRATYGDRTIDVERFNAYVKRTIAIPDGVDPSRITTGVVIDPDGTVRHVPTKVVRIDGKFYA